MNTTHGGNIWELARQTGRPAREWLDFSASINPLGPPAWLAGMCADHLPDLAHYPDPEMPALRQALAEHCGIAADGIVPGNGSSELLFALPRLGVFRRAIIPVPAYMDYRRAMELAGIPVQPVRLAPADNFAIPWQSLRTMLQPGDLVILGRPNNPTGALPAADHLTAAIHDYPATFFLLDEAFLDFTGEPSQIKMSDPRGGLPDNLIVLNSMTKFFAIPGLRLGFAALPSTMAGKLRQALTPWSVNTLAQMVGARAYADLDYAARTRALVAANRRELCRRLASAPAWRVFPATANFVLLQLQAGAKHAGGALAAALRRHGIAIRVCGNFEGLDEQYIRLAVRTAGEQERLCGLLAGLGLLQPAP